ncbi:bifunctional DNA-formamidopyrimidine glycosylase/DNA-(apurinic or apyrimidinic site) lyase [Aquibaculum sediminis]|uniref:bifunctional DNA-formamidopyrimidine glycosylase/DNA-(apurinic or apyrimidinic site) lyase n=1 Tax=Aquibaculum sediminis TaxID=3231907 RepID=UPI0034517FDB
MPELPEVETVRRGLQPLLEGRRLVSVLQRRPDLRFPLPLDFVARLEGQRVERIDRRAKYLLLHLDSAEVLLVHLGMSGRMLLIDDPDSVDLLPHDHIVLRTEEGREVRFNDARRFGYMDIIPAAELVGHRHLVGLGPEPLGNDFNGPVLAAALANKRTPIKAALLDQRVVAGLGNIYVCEALYHAGIAPGRLALTVQEHEADALAQAIRRVLTEAIAAGGSSLRDYVQTSGELGYFQHSWAVYGREGLACPACDCGGPAAGGISRLVQSGRSTFYCPHRQR